MANIKTLVARYGANEASWFNAQIDEFWANARREAGDDEPYEYADSFRYARKGVSSEELEYEETMSCCGSVDVTFGPSPAGHTYMYGFNYGH